jgi:uncharacterized protein YgiM (DUF1202 family)
VGTVTNTGGLDLFCRTEPNTSAMVITVLAPGTSVEVLGEESDGWVPVRCADQDGWVSAQYLTIGEVPDTGPPTATVVTNGPLASCRIEPNTTSLIIARVESGTQVTIRGATTNGWVPVTCDGQDGWIFEDLIQGEPGG